MYSGKKIQFQKSTLKMHYDDYFGQALSIGCVEKFTLTVSGSDDQSCQVM